MGTYIFSMMKPKPVKLVAVIDGIEQEILCHRIRFHGAESYPGDRYVEDKFCGKRCNKKSPKYATDLRRIYAQTLKRWLTCTPKFGISTSGYEGELDWEGNRCTPPNTGYSVYRLKGQLVWYEEVGFGECLGTVRKEGRDFVFTPEVAQAKP